MTRFVLAILAATALAGADSRIMTGMNAFTTASYRQLSGGDGNLILSPFNIATALSMVLAGARGKTAEEMESVLRVHYDSAYNASLGALVADLTAAGNSGDNQIHAGNGLWVQKGFPIEPVFEKTLADDYHAPLTPLDFMTNAEAARSQINRWTEKQTNDKIKDLFPAGSLDDTTRLVLTSAIYFYGKWQDPFLPDRTQPAPFTLPTGAQTQASFMNQTAHFGYNETPSSQILEMRYAGTGIAFDVLLPKTLAGLHDVEQSLTPENLTGWLGKLAIRNVRVSLPKFRAESKFSLRQGLSAMGMPTAFTHQADFSGISAKGGLEISDVVHKAFVDVSERGTEAAAATGVAMRAMAMRSPEPVIEFRADRPFLFLIRDTKSGVVLFIGRLMDAR